MSRTLKNYVNKDKKEIRAGKVSTKNAISLKRNTPKKKP